MRTPRADSVIELDQLQRRFDHLGHDAGDTDFAALQRECDRVVALLPAEDQGWARDRIDLLRTRLLHRRSTSDAGAYTGEGPPDADAPQAAGNEWRSP